MTEWEPATDAEVAMRNALRTDDQESYFRILAGVDLLLPVSADALAGLAPLGWGTWSTGGRTHVLAFTSPSALQACLADYTGSARRVAYTELAETWPNLEWWLAVNPGLPIEGYLPAWFVAQLSRGDLRLPTRGPGPAGSNAPNRIQDLHAAATLAATAAAQGYNASAQDYAAPASGGPLQGGAGSAGPAYGDSAQRGPGSGAAAQSRPVPAADHAGSGGSGGAASARGESAYATPGSSGAPAGRPATAPGGSAAEGAPVGPGGLPLRTPGAVLPSGLPSRVPATPGGQGGGIPGGQFNGFGISSGSGERPGNPAERPGDAAGQSGGSDEEARGFAGETQPGGAPLAARGASSQPGGTALGGRGAALQPGGPANGGRDAAPQSSGGSPQSGGGSSQSGGGSSQAGGGSSRLGGASSLSSGASSQLGGASAASASETSIRESGSRTSGAPAVPAAYSAPTLPASGATTSGAPARSSGGPSALDALGSRSGTNAGGPQQQRADSPLPTRTPMAQTPPLPAHIPPPADADEDTPAGGTASDQAPAGAISAKLAARDGAVSAKLADQAGVTPGRSGPDQAAEDKGPGGLPRRQVTPPEERPASMAAAAQALANRGTGTTQPPPVVDQPPAAQQPSARPGLAPPVIPGAGGAGRATNPIIPAGAARPPVPPATRDEMPDRAEVANRAETADRGSVDRYEAADRTQVMHLPSAPGEAALTHEAETPREPAPSAGAATPAMTDRTQPEAASRDADTNFDEDFDEDFVPANEVERDLHHAVGHGSTDSFLSTLLLATVLVPVANNSRPGSAPGESGFAFRTEEINGDRFLVVFTSRDRLAEHFAEPTRTVGVRFVDLIRNWPDPAWSFAVNPTSAIGARYPGPQVIALANWAVEAGLGGDPLDAPAEQPQRPDEPTAHLTVMQKAVPAEQIDYYLERGYDRVAGFVHRATEVEHLRSPGDLFSALGLLYDGSPYQADAKEAFVLRWAAHRPSLYRIPYGGQSEQALRAMDGWVIERPPFRGNGFAPGEGKDVIAEFKVDSVRLPHGAQLWQMDADGAEQMIAVFDCDAPVWRRVGGQ